MQYSLTSHGGSASNINQMNGAPHGALPEKRNKP